MNNFYLLFLCLALTANCLSGCSSVTSEQVGQGLVVGSIGSGVPVIGAVGAAVDVIGSAWNSREGSPEYQKRRAKAYSDAAKIAFSLDFAKGINARPETTKEEVTAKAQAYCDDVAKKVTAQEVVLLNRKTMKMFSFPDEFLPEGDEEIIRYNLTTNPFGETCLWALEGWGMGKVRETRDKAAKAGN